MKEETKAPDRYLGLGGFFTLDEMTKSQTATRFDFHEQFTPPPPVIENLEDLVTEILAPLRASIRLAVHVSSGYRCPRLNERIGGAETSQHVKGEAADISVRGWSPEKLYQYIKNSGLPFDQLIQEFDQWVHVSHDPHKKKQRGNCLRAVRENGHTIYKVDNL